MDRPWDVVVVGAGPAGSGAAAALAGWGLRTLVLEEHPAIGSPSCCSGIIGPECLSAWPIPPQVVLRELKDATFFSPSGKALSVRSSHPQAYGVDRVALDRFLAGVAQERGAEYHLGARVEGVRVSPEQVVLSLEGGGEVVGQMAILAPGFPSPLPGKMGMGEVGRWAIAAQAPVETPIDQVEVYLGQRVAPGFFAWLVPTSPGQGLAGVMASRPGPYLSRFLARLRQEGKISGESGPACFRRLPLSPPHRTYGPRLLLVGEAAGQLKTTTGGGIYYGLIGAQIAAETTKEAFETGDFSSRFLRRYQSRWLARLGPELRWGGWARRLYSRLSDAQIENILARIEASGLVNSVMGIEGFSFDWHSPAIRYALKQEALRGLRRLLPFPRRHQGIEENQ